MVVSFASPFTIRIHSTRISPMKPACTFCVLMCLFTTPPVAAELVVVGGDGGLDWAGGGGEIQATVIRGATSVESTNAPGGVIDFAAEGFAEEGFARIIASVNAFTFSTSDSASNESLPTAA